MRFVAYLPLVLLLSVVPVRAQMPSGPPSVGVVRAQQTAITETSEFIGRIQAVERVALTAPAVVALLCIREQEIAPASDAAQGRKTSLGAQIRNVADLMRRPPVVIFAACVMLFHLANAAMLPLAASLVTLRSNQMATILVAAAIVVPQFTVTLLSPIVGRLADSWGRRPLLLIGFGALAARGVLFALFADPRALAAIQLLDGISAAALGVLAPLTIADLTRETGHFNLAQGVVGCAMGLGASLSTTVSGYVSDIYGGAAAFDLLAAVSVAGFAFLAIALPETRPDATPPP